MPSMLAYQSAGHVSHVCVTLFSCCPARHDRHAIREKLHDRGVEAGLLSFAIHKLGSFAGSDASMPIAEHLATRGLALPLYPQMRDVEAEEVVSKLSGVLHE